MSEFRRLTIAETRMEPNDMLWVRLDVPARWRAEFDFQHGQHLTLSVAVNGQPVRRTYSICAAVGGALAVAIKRIGGGAFSDHAHRQFAPGVDVDALPPAGKFTCDLLPAAHRRYLCVAAGSGITPILSIIETVLGGEPGSEVTLLYGNRRSTSIAFGERLNWLKNAYLTRFQWINVLSQEAQPTEILNGRLDYDKAVALNECLVPIADHDEFFLCGPEGMTAAVSRCLDSLGVDPTHIHDERFFASEEDAKAAGERQAARAQRYAGLTTEVRVRRGGREVDFPLGADGENILDGAIRAGLPLPFSCRSGVCATCRARLIEGQVEMDVNHALTPAEVASSHILTCQSHPISDRVVVDFDQV